MGDVREVLGRVRRDKRIANLLYGLLGWEDEADPQAAIADLARIARAELVGADPAYRVRVAEAAGLLIELCVRVAAGDDPAEVLGAGRAEIPAAPGRVIELVGDRVVELPAGDVCRYCSTINGPTRDGACEDCRDLGRVVELEAGEASGCPCSPGAPKHDHGTGGYA